MIITNGKRKGEILHFFTLSRIDTTRLANKTWNFRRSIAISPLHDKDLSSVEGQKYKKAHYHVIYISKNPVTAESVRLKIKRALGDKSVAKVQIVVQSMENMYLYLTHESKDAIAKNKHKYSKHDIALLNNFDIDRYITLDVEDKDDMLNDVCDLIDDHNLANMRELRRF